MVSLSPKNATEVNNRMDKFKSVFYLGVYLIPQVYRRIREMRSETNVSIAILISLGRNEAERTVVRFFSTELMIRVIAFEY